MCYSYAHSLYYPVAPVSQQKFILVLQLRPGLIAFDPVVDRIQLVEDPEVLLTGFTLPELLQQYILSGPEIIQDRFLD